MRPGSQPEREGATTENQWRWVVRATGAVAVAVVVSGALKLVNYLSRQRSPTALSSAGYRTMTEADLGVMPTALEVIDGERVEVADELMPDEGADPYDHLAS